MRFSSSFASRVFLVALALRLVLVLCSYPFGIGLDDMFQYDMLARSLAAGNGYRWYAQEDLPLIQSVISLDPATVEEYDPRGVLTSFRPPLYPAFLALIYLIFGSGAHRFFVARLVQAFLGAALAPLTWMLAKRLASTRGEMGEKAARLAAWIVAVYPMLVVYPLALATENLFFLLLLLSVLALLKAEEAPIGEGVRVADHAGRAPVAIVRHPSARWFVLAGVLLGLTSLTRSVALAFAALAVLWIGFVLKRRHLALLTFAAIALTILPWIVRNSLLHRRLAGIETALGYDLYVSYHPQSRGTFQYPQSLDLLSIVDDMERERVALEKVRQFILAAPARVPLLMLNRFGLFFGLERRALTYFYSNNFFGYIPPVVLLTTAAILLLPFPVISTSAAFGLALSPWRRETSLLVLLFAGYITPHILVIAEDRFHLALVPFLAILAAFCWTGGLPALRAQARAWTGRLALALALLTVFLLFLGWGLELWRDADKLVLLLGPEGNQIYFPY